MENKEILEEYVKNGIITLGRNILSNGDIYDPTVGAYNTNALTFVDERVRSKLVSKSRVDELIERDVIIPEWGTRAYMVKAYNNYGKVQEYSEYSQDQTISDVDFKTYQTGIMYLETKLKLDLMEKDTSSLNGINDIFGLKLASGYDNLMQVRDEICVKGRKDNSLLPISGLLTNRELKPWIDVPGGSWTDKTAIQIYDSIREMIEVLREQSKDEAMKAVAGGQKLRLGLPLSKIGCLNILFENTGVTLGEQLQRIYNGALKIVPMIEFDNYGSNGNVAVMFVHRSEYQSTFETLSVGKLHLYPINEIDHHITQVMAIGTGGTVLREPTLTVRFKGL